MVIPLYFCIQRTYSHWHTLTQSCKPCRKPFLQPYDLFNIYIVSKITATLSIVNENREVPEGSQKKVAGLKLAQHISDAPVHIILMH